MFYLVFHMPNFFIALINLLDEILNIMKMNIQESKERMFESKVKEIG